VIVVERPAQQDDQPVALRRGKDVEVEARREVPEFLAERGRQPSVDACARTPSSTSPRMTASMTRASRRASQAPRDSAARAYTSAASKATSRE